MAQATSVDTFLESLPEEKRAQMTAARRFILNNLAPGYEEIMQGNMIGYVVPHSVFPAGYHCNPKQPLGYMALACGKNYFSLHMLALYFDPQQQTTLEEEFSNAGKKLNMGKACVRFKSLDDLALVPLGNAISRMTVDKYIARYESSLQSRKG